MIHLSIQPHKMEVSTSNPAPPTGLTPTEVPLGITSTTSPSGGPINASKGPPKFWALSEGLYYGTFDVSILNGPNDVVFEWNSTYPLGNFTNPYNTITNANNTRFFVPWELWPAFFSRECKVDWEICFTAIKVADCRVSFDISFLYDQNGSFPGPQANFVNNDSFHKIFDSQDDTFSIVPPMFWVSNNVQTDNFRINLAGNVFVPPAFVPTTRMQVRIRNPYYPNMTQPDSFTVVVTVKPIIRQAIGIAGRAAFRSLNNNLDVQVHRPYFLNDDSAP